MGTANQSADCTDDSEGIVCPRGWATACLVMLKSMWAGPLAVALVFLLALGVSLLTERRHK